MNICAKCEHRCILAGDGSNVMANSCGAPEVGFDPVVNPVTGDMCWMGQSDDGESLFYTDIPTPLCLFINPRGECQYFVAAGGAWFEQAIKKQEGC